MTVNVNISEMKVDVINLLKTLCHSVEFKFNAVILLQAFGIYFLQFLVNFVLNENHSALLSNSDHLLLTSFLFFSDELYSITNKIYYV